MKSNLDHLVKDFVGIRINVRSEGQFSLFYSSHLLPEKQHKLKRDIHETQLYNNGFELFSKKKLIIIL